MWKLFRVVKELSSTWYGLILAYLLIIVIGYFLIWQYYEPLQLTHVIRYLLTNRALACLVTAVFLSSLFVLLVLTALKTKVAKEVSGCTNAENCIVRDVVSENELDEVFELRAGWEKEKENFLRHMQQSRCLLEGHFLLVSGKHSARFLRYQKILDNVDAREYFVKQMLTLIRFIEDKKKIKCTAILGPAETAGGRLANYVATELRVPFRAFSSGEEASKRRFRIHRERFRDLDGKACVIVDDVVTTGEGLVSAVTKLHNQGIKVIGAVATFVRDPGVASDVISKMNALNAEFQFFAYAKLEIFTWDAKDCKLCRVAVSQQLN